MLAIVGGEGAGTHRLLESTVDCKLSMKETVIPVILRWGNKVAQIILKDAVHALSLPISLWMISSAHSLLGLHELA